MVPQSGRGSVRHSTAVPMQGLGGPGLILIEGIDRDVRKPLDDHVPDLAVMYEAKRLLGGNL